MKASPRAPLSALPASLAPIGLRRGEAAEFVRVGVTLFDQMVADRRMPEPRLINSLAVWDVHELTIAFRALPTRASKPERNPFDPPEQDDEGHDA